MEAVKEKVDEPKVLKKIENKFVTFIKNNLIFILGIILLTYKGLVLSSLLELEIKFKNVEYILLASSLIMCPIINNRKKSGYIYLNIVYTIVTLIIYSDYLYYNYSTNFLSFYQIGNIKYAKEIGDGLSSLINIKNLSLFWFDSIIVIFLSIFFYKKFKYNNKDLMEYSNTILQSDYIKNCSINSKILKLVIILIILIMNILTIKSDINEIYKEKGYNKTLIVKGMSIYYYHYEDAKDYFSNIFIKEKIDEEKLEKIYNENINRKTQQTEYSNSAKDCNVIILQLESLNEYVIGKKINGKEITPNLNKFFDENIYCTNMYNQGLGTTADSEFEMENSMYPLENGYVFQKYYGNKWNDIYSTLKEEGYYTSFMHPNVSTFWNRDAVYNSGYEIDKYYDINAFEGIENAGEFYSDEGFFEKAVDIMNTYEEKFCTTLVSVTTHIPFELDGVYDLENKLTIEYEELEEYEEWVFKNYILSCNFVDYAFGKFIEKLEETKLMDNSILIVYGDHGSGIIVENDLKKLYQNNNLEYTEFEKILKDVHIPFGMKIPTVESTETIDRAVSKIDIKPTILDLLGIKQNFSLGDTIFSEKDYSFIKGLGYITSEYYCINGEYYNKQTLEPIEENEELKQLMQMMQDEIYLSDTIIKNNLLYHKK